MSLLQDITELPTYTDYLAAIGKTPSYQIDKSFACGLPAIWLYMKAIGLEDHFFDLLTKVEDQELLFKELFYLLLITNAHDKYFPHLPDNLLKLKIPAAILEAQCEVTPPEFALAFSFTADELQSTLQHIALPNKMIRLGDRRYAVGLMFANNKYYVYHSNSTKPSEFKDLTGTAEFIIKVLARGKK